MHDSKVLLKFPEDPSGPHRFEPARPLRFKPEDLKEITALFESATQAGESPQLGPDNLPSAAIMLRLARFEVATGNYSDARRLFRQLIHLDPDNVAVLTYWASLELLDKRPIQAQDLFLQAARAHARHDRINEARGSYQQAVDSHRTQASAWFEWGTFEEWQGNPERARECFSSAAEADASFYSRWVNFVARLEGSDKARAMLHEAHDGGRVGPHMAETWAAWGLLEVQLGDWVSGERRVREAVERARGNNDKVLLAESLAILAQAQAEMGRAGEAEETFRQAHAADPDNALVKIQNAQHLVIARGQIDAATELFSEALRLAPHSYEVMRLRERFERLRRKRGLLASWLELRDAATQEERSDADGTERSERLVAALAEEIGCPTAPLALSKSEFSGLQLHVRELFGDSLIDPALPVLVVQGNDLSREALTALGSELSQGYRVKRAVVILAAEGQPRFSARKVVEYVRGAYNYDIILLDRNGLLELLHAEDIRSAVCQLILSQVNLKNISPFQTVGPVYDTGFFGREQELGEISSRIGKSSYVIIGGRLIGKTSILRQLQKVRLPAIGFNAFFHDCSYTSTKEELIMAVTGRRGGWFENGLVPRPLSLGEVIDALPADRPLVVLLDEVDKLIEPDRQAGYPIFSTIAAVSKSEVCRFVLCGERALQSELNNVDSPLFNFATPMYVGRLEPQAVEELVIQSMRQLRIELADEGEIMRHIHEFSSGHPNIVQILCQRLVERLNRRYPARITPEDIVEVVKTPEFLTRDFLKVYWQRATVLERLASLVMVTDPAVHTLDSVHSALLRQGIEGVGANEVSEALGRLVDLRNILARTRTDGYEFAAKAFPRVFTSVVCDSYITRYRDVYLKLGDVVPRGEA